MGKVNSIPDHVIMSDLLWSLCRHFRISKKCPLKLACTLITWGSTHCNVLWTSSLNRWFQQTWHYTVAVLDSYNYFSYCRASGMLHTRTAMAHKYKYCNGVLQFAHSYRGFIVNSKWFQPFLIDGSIKLPWTKLFLSKNMLYGSSCTNFKELRICLTLQKYM